MTSAVATPREEQTQSPTGNLSVELTKEQKLEAYRNRIEPLSAVELKELLSLVGFEGKALKIAWAIVMTESNARPKAFNGNTKTGDSSYGIFQINMIGQLGVDRREKFELDANHQLFDPVENAQIAFHMTKGGDDWGSWGLGPNAYADKNLTRYKTMLTQYPLEEKK